MDNSATASAVLVPKWAGQFDTFQHWVNKASSWLSVGEFEARAICVDAKGRRCHQGGDFMRARDEDAFPVRFFWDCELVSPAPAPMLLFCPACDKQHIDEPQPSKGWDNPPHRSHECQGCGHVWRPADVPTTGVVALETAGQRDGSASPLLARSAAQVAGRIPNRPW